MCEESILNLFIIEGLMRSDESSVAAYIQLVAVMILDLQAGSTLARIMYRSFFRCSSIFEVLAGSIGTDFWP
jgi:hypothetical protein